MLGQAFIDSQFNYAPLQWVFCRKGLYLKMQKIHHETLNVIYQSNKTDEELLELTETQYLSATLKSFSLLKFIKVLLT